MFRVDKDYNIIDLDKHKKQMSKVLSQDKWNDIVDVVSNWKTKEELTDDPAEDSGHEARLSRPFSRVATHSLEE